MLLDKTAVEYGLKVSVFNPDKQFEDNQPILCQKKLSVNTKYEIGIILVKILNRGNFLDYTSFKNERIPKMFHPTL